MSVTCHLLIKDQDSLTESDIALNSPASNATNIMITEQNPTTLAGGALDELVATTLCQQDQLDAPVPQGDAVTRTLAQSGAALIARQYKAGYWRFDLEADTTIPAEYLLLQHLLGRVNQDREKRLCDYIISRQLADGSWPLYEAGPGNISATVKAYFALKMAGHDPASPIMKQARIWIHGSGGAERANVFTRILLATFGQIPWRTVPAMLAEIIWLPKWWVFNLSKVSYWSRCVIIPLLLIFAHRPVHKPPAGRGVEELFAQDPGSLKHIDKYVKDNALKNVFIFLDRTLKLLEPWVPGFVRRLSIQKLESWMREHMRGEGGIGAIYPAMANAVYALKLLGYDGSDPDMRRGMKAIEALVIEEDDVTYVQPCVSPVWDTCLSLSALSEAGLQADHEAMNPAIDWLFDKQVFTRGDWALKAPFLEGGGWAFQFENDFYPDVDDTSMVVMALLRAGAHHCANKKKRLAQAVNWVLGMQNTDGGWGAFDIDNDDAYLNNIPFADHGALVDPSTADLTGRCIEMLAMLGYERHFPPIARAIAFLKQEQEQSGAWFGRWGVNYIYGTWAVLVGLGALGEAPNQPYIRKAIAWLKRIQNSDGGWGEDCRAYDDPQLKGNGVSTASQTAWALLGLMAVGEIKSSEVEKGVHFLTRHYEGEGGWKEVAYTGTGFPRVFYLRYHGYSHYFPVWALGVYRRYRQGLQTRQDALTRGEPIDLGVLPILHNKHYQRRFSKAD